MDLSNVKWIQVEATTKCNAWCPGCPRNKHGFGLADHLVIEDLNSARFKEVLELFPNLETVDFCGTFGDAIAANNIIDLTKIAMQHASNILVRTNGSLRSTTWWQEYADLLKHHQHSVWFCIDGLEDTHPLYRQGTDYQKILDNAQSFIQAGGSATWQFIPWQHNEHQIKDCIRLSQQLGFKKFELIKNIRANFSARHYRTGQHYDIDTWSKNSKLNHFIQPKSKVVPQGCMHLSKPSMYLNANGTLNVCCFFNNHKANNNPSKLMDISVNISNPATTPRVCLSYCGSAAVPAGASDES